MDKFLSCDWGTSSFRLRLVEGKGLAVLAEEIAGKGIAVIHQEWLQEKKNKDRLQYYLSFLNTHIEKLEGKAGITLSGLPLILSGMASSSIGMIELPYKELPFQLDGSDIRSHTIEASENFPHKMIVISGGKMADDVLRGEETLLIGADIPQQDGESVCIFPGTHSKHIRIENDKATSFKTYMTGEFFDLLSTKSILSNSVKKEDIDSVAVNRFFAEGIIKGSSANLLNAVFHVRTHQLFSKNSKKENYHFLSGLVIGAELRDLLQNPPQSIVLVSGNRLKYRYMQGLSLLLPGQQLEFLNADEALVKGQWRICQAIEKRLQQGS